MERDIEKYQREIRGFVSELCHLYYQHSQPEDRSDIHNKVALIALKKGNMNTGVVEPPFAAESMLEFLIVPSLTDPGQLAASIETVETFLLAHRDDLAMHAKLVELYEAQLKLQPLANADGSALAKKLSAERNRFLELLNRKHLTKGDDNVEK